MPTSNRILNLFVIVFVFIAKLHSISCSAIFSSDPYAQQQLDRISKLPGQNFNVSFAHYAGYVTVNNESGRALFYWFFEADEDPSSKPIVLWLNGGPGCSSIAYGLAEEIGPFHIEEDGKTLYLNPYSWTKAANILFLDSPVGVGFSYSNITNDQLNNGDKRTAADNLEFLLEWFKRFPQYKGRDFYITGESYAGHYVPQLSQAIVRHNHKNGEVIINLKGFMVGNALTDDFHDYLGLFQFMWSVGMISDETFKQLNVFCDSQSFIHTSGPCDKVLDIADEEIGDIDMYSIFTPPCTANFNRFSRLLKQKKKVGLIRRAYDPCTEQHSTVYFNLPEVQNVLHVHKKNSPSKWETCSEEVNENWKDTPMSVLDIYRELIPLGLRIWIFSGDTDAVIPVTSTRYSIDALNLPTTSPWRAWYDDGQVGGWTQEYNGLTFVTVRGAGHEVALHKPKQALTLIKSYLSGNSMPKLKQVSDL
ncbi:serine carboxypeptidase II-2 [Olea europaea subsp. europaea]|uniref:Carboxypeptidase n=1 Tax=Olea europaea subsp. europaea TaxID=158383 RepID=A0A8S0QK27_OLEEU|nr:serine carboxypeptidase II-2 [Olea europaea subsp. europaea]